MYLLFPVKIKNKTIVFYFSKTECIVEDELTSLLNYCIQLPFIILSESGISLFRRGGYVVTDISVNSS
jgi:hypothetical protein